MKIFISQVFRDHTEEEIRTMREQVVRYLMEHFPTMDIEVISNIIEDDNASAISMLGRSIDLMANADLVVFAPGWTSGRGTLIEYDVAINYGKPVLDLNRVDNFN